MMFMSEPNIGGAVSNKFCVLVSCPLFWCHLYLCHGRSKVSEQARMAHSTSISARRIDKLLTMCEVNLDH